ncbi:MAG TPA: TonB family protein, partial [Polymorphobacter sp.]|nr:TonB family protein [Polymorphobacter sp.]
GIVRARWASGSISNRDYPKAARAAGVGGAVTVHFDVRADGGVEHCRVVASSGSALLDETTCRLIAARFRYVPARDASGAAITDIAGWRQDWWLGAPKQ